MNAYNPFGALCRMLESLTHFRGTTADWVRWLGTRLDSAEEIFGLFQRAFLRKEPTPATHMFCPDCHCRHEVFVWTIERIAAARAELFPPTHPALALLTIPPVPPSISAVCRCEDHCGCPDLQLTAAEIEVWSLNWARLARELCRAFELAPQFVPGYMRNTCQVGSWSSAAVPVFLTIQPDRERLRWVILELITRCRERFILLQPTSRHLDSACLELLANANAGCFPLDGNLVLTHNATLQATRPPGELFVKFTPPLSDSDFSEAQRIFALVRQLDSESRIRLPSVLTVLRLYCIEELNVGQIAGKCRCAKGTISNRLRQIRKATGTDPILFRRISDHFDRMMDAASDSRARTRHVRVDG